MTTPASSEATDFADRFTGYIQSVCADPGARAALRRGARKRPDDAPTMHRYLAAWTKPTDSAHRVAVLYAVASWIALYADTTSAQDRPDLGVALARATSRRNGTAIATGTMETRLMSLARATPTQVLYQHLPAILPMLRSTGNLPNFAHLTRSLMAIPYDAPKVSRRWMSDYYRTLNTSAPTAEPPIDPTSAPTP